MNNEVDSQLKKAVDFSSHPLLFPQLVRNIVEISLPTIHQSVLHFMTIVRHFVFPQAQHEFPKKRLK